MMRESTLPAPAAVTAPTESAVPWTLWIAVAAVTSAMIGIHWDISWHRSIGRDTFWTPAHIAMYMCGVLGGIAAGYLILTTTFGKHDAPSVRVFGFRGPLGAFIVAWGGIAMLMAAPFDDWWHNAYGLDVKIISPPHTLLELGIVAIQLGALILVLGHMNRATGAMRRQSELLFLYLGGMILVNQLIFLFEWTQRAEMHAGFFYRNLSIAVPFTLVGLARASHHKWASTIVASVYTLLLLGLLWILPLFPAQPKLGPVYNQVTHFVPAGFPLLVLVPAIALDLLRARLGDQKNPWLLAAVYGLTWLAVFALVQWPFANFLMTPGARNWVFGQHYVDYNARPFWGNMRTTFPDYEHGNEFIINMGIAVVLSIVLSRLALGFGDWMRKIRR
jgi:hypothetical protein